MSGLLIEKRVPFQSQQEERRGRAFFTISETFWAYMKQHKTVLIRAA
jgi:hypothetical protein